MRTAILEERAGFTLLELLVVLGILSVVTTIGMGAFVSVTGNWRTTEIRAALNARADNIFRGMRRDLDRLVSSRVSGAPVLGSSGSAQQDSLFWHVPLANDRLVLPVFDTDPATGRSQAIRVSYGVERTGAVPMLVRTMGGLGETTPDGARETAGMGVLGFRVAYLRGGQWQSEWQFPGHPEAIRVSLVLIDADRPYEQVARECVFPVHVR